jgi:hypothetical protein
MRSISTPRGDELLGLCIAPGVLVSLPEGCAEGFEKAFEFVSGLTQESGLSAERSIFVHGATLRLIADDRFQIAVPLALSPISCLFCAVCQEQIRMVLLAPVAVSRLFLLEPAHPASGSWVNGRGGFVLANVAKSGHSCLMKIAEGGHEGLRPWAVQTL